MKSSFFLTVAFTAWLHGLTSGTSMFFEITQLLGHSSPIYLLLTRVTSCNWQRNCPVVFLTKRWVYWLGTLLKIVSWGFELARFSLKVVYGNLYINLVQDILSYFKLKCNLEDVQLFAVWFVWYSCRWPPGCSIRGSAPSGTSVRCCLVWHRIIILWKKVATCRIHSGQDHVQYDVEISFWHSKCWPYVPWSSLFICKPKVSNWLRPIVVRFSCSHL